MIVKHVFLSFCFKEQKIIFENSCQEKHKSRDCNEKKEVLIKS